MVLQCCLWSHILPFFIRTSSRMFHPNMDAPIPNRTLHAQISVLDKLFICKRLVQHLCVSFSCPTNNFFCCQTWPISAFFFFLLVQSEFLLQQTCSIAHSFLVCYQTDPYVEHTDLFVQLPLFFATQFLLFKSF